MANVRIEMDRGKGWEVRQEGDCNTTADAIVAALPSYTSQYPHRAYLDGVLVASNERRRNGRVIVTRHGA